MMAMVGLSGMSSSTGRDPSVIRHDSPESLPVDSVLADLVVEDAAGGLEQARGLGAVASRALERVLQDVLLERFSRLFERLLDDGASLFRSLEGGRQMVRVQHLLVAHHDGALNG